MTTMTVLLVEVPYRYEYTFTVGSSQSWIPYFPIFHIRQFSALSELQQASGLDAQGCGDVEQNFQREGTDDVGSFNGA